MGKAGVCGEIKEKPKGGGSCPQIHGVLNKSAIKVVLALLPEPSRKEFPSVACFQPPSFTTISWEDPAAEAAMLLAFPSQSLRCPHRDCPRKGTAVGVERHQQSKLGRERKSYHFFISVCP